MATSHTLTSAPVAVSVTCRCRCSLTLPLNAVVDAMKNLSPPPGARWLGWLGILGLTPQAMNLSPLRGSPPLPTAPAAAPVTCPCYLSLPLIPAPDRCRCSPTLPLNPATDVRTTPGRSGTF